MTLNKQWNCSNCTKFALIVGLILWPDSSVGWSVWTEFSGDEFQSHPDQLSIATSKNPSGWIPYVSFIRLHIRLSQANFNESKRGDWWRQKPKWNLTLNKRWNWSSCTKLALSMSWTYGLIAQSVRASEFKSHPGQISIAISRNLSVVNTIYKCIDHSIVPYRL